MTSELELGITEQPEPTCPEVDAAVKALKDLIRLCRGAARMDEEELRDALDDVDRELPDVINSLESLRSANQAIRKWGQEWKDKAKEALEG